MELDICSSLYVFLLLLLIFTSYWFVSAPKNLPPGSCGFPILGYIPFLDKEAHLTFENLKGKYGSIFHLYLGSRLVVVLNDYEAVREAFVKQADIFSGRPPDAMFRESKTDNLGVVVNDGEHWKQHRRFILSNLRDFGVGKLSLEPLIMDELQHFLAEIKKSEGKSFAIKEILNNSLANNIHILVTGKRYDYDHAIMKELFDLFHFAEREIPQLNILMFFPWLAYIPGLEFLTKRKTIRKFYNRLHKTIQKIVDSVKSEYSEEKQEVYIHAYITEQRARRKLNENEDIFSDVGLLHNTRDLLFAGTETSAATLHWALLYLTLHPDIQKKVQDEIDSVIGREREPSFIDRGNLPYTEATIMELHRVISLVPLSVPHRNVKDTMVLGYFIPKNTVIFANIWAVHHDEAIWGDPNNFRPERFLSPEGQIRKSEHLIPFSVGKRTCAGEPLARMEVFLYFVSLMQHFTFVPPDGVLPTLGAFNGSGRRPQFQNICAKLRK